MENKNYNKRKKKCKKQNKKEELKPSKLSLFDKERTIFLNTDINDSMAKEIVEKLLQLDLVNHEDITLYINSPGGSVSAGLAICDAMNYIKSDVSTVAIGRVASMGSIVLINGTKGKRYALPNSEVMIHEVSTLFIGGDITRIKEQMKHAEIVNERLCRLLVKNSNRTLKQIKEATVKRDSWYSAQTCLKYGFVDKVLY